MFEISSKVMGHRQDQTMNALFMYTLRSSLMTAATLQQKC